MRASLAGCLAAILVFAGAAFAQQPAESPSMPFNPFDGAKAGDWATYALQVSGKRSGSATWRVEKVTEDQVAMHAEAQSPEESKPDANEFKVSRKGIPTVAGAFGDSGSGHPVTVTSTSEEKHKAGDREFACTKVVLLEHLADKDGDSITLWFSREVKCQGLVEMRVSGNEEEIAYTLAGFGNGEKADWGKTPAENLPGGADTLLPLNPFTHAAAGDWATYSGTRVDADGKKHEVTSTWRVASVEGEDVVVSVFSTDDGKPAAHQADLLFSTKSAPALRTFLQVGKELRISDVKAEDAAHKAGGKEFSCRKVTFNATDGTDSFSGTAWISADVRGGGVVEARFASARKDGPRIDLRLKGFGNGEKAVWGRLPEDR
jgi:hypothetical protein